MRSNAHPSPLLSAVVRAGVLLRAVGVVVVVSLGYVGLLALVLAVRS